MRCCTYLRVSTHRQGRSGLGLEAQRKMCADFITSNGGDAVQEFVDVESGTHRDRKGLLNAINYCKANNCALVIAKLDRLARDVEFCFKVVNTGIKIHFCDFPTMNTLLLGVFASVAQYERELTSERTKKALAVKKKQGCKLGASNPRYQETRNKKSEEERKKEEMQRGELRTERHLASRESQAFLKVLKMVYPDHTTDADPKKWEWLGIKIRCAYTDKMIETMRNFKEMDSEGRIFSRFDFDDPLVAKRLRSYLQAFRKSVLR